MKAMYLTKNSGIWYLVTITSLFLVIGGLITLINGFLACRSKEKILLRGINFLAGFSLFMVLMDCARFAYLSSPDSRYQPFQYKMFELPWALYAGLEAVLLLFLILLIWDDQRYCGSHLTPDAIRETVNLLPEGLCISAADGTVLLSNMQMNAICRAMASSDLSDAARFRQMIETNAEKQNEETLIRTPEGKAWRFSQDQIAVDKSQYDLLTATDVTAQYRVIEELREKNERLKDIQQRMKAVSDLSGDMFVAQEEMDARVALHNQLGQVLLMGRHYLEHPESTDVQRIYLATSQMNSFLLGEVQRPGDEMEDEMELALFLAGSIGVSVKMTGEPPLDPGSRILLADAIRECAVNAVKHANGDTVFVEIDGNTVLLTNNGSSPKGPITESGGLLALRQRTEAAGGTMIVQSQPAFSLMIRFP